jgi:hypothetical protein
MAEHATQTRPPFPHCAGAVPGRHVPSFEQHPLLQVSGLQPPSE